MLVDRLGVSLLGGALDEWFKRDFTGDKAGIAEDEFEVKEWRLSQRLKVDHFMLPPDFRKKKPYSTDDINKDLTLPYLRFPNWHVCRKRRCRELRHVSLQERQQPECCGLYMVQVPIVAICEDGHLQDFPWREWVHRKALVDCTGKMRLSGEGSTSLLDQSVRCECGAARILRGGFGSSSGRSNLSRRLLSGANDEASEGGHQDYPCQGIRPWTGKLTSANCNRDLVASFRNSSNVYYAQVVSSIFIPKVTQGAPSGLLAYLENDNIDTWLSLQESNCRLEGRAFCAAEILQERPSESSKDKKMRDRFRQFSESEVDAFLAVRGSDSALGLPQVVTDVADGIDKAADFRFQEYGVLTKNQDELDLKIKEVPIGEYHSSMRKAVSSVMLIEKLRETRVLNGFTRVVATNHQTLSERQNMLRCKPITDPTSRWLPANVVYGEGIFLKLDEIKLQAWESDKKIIERIAKLNRNAEAAQRAGSLGREISPRFVLLHTFAHLLINQLTFDCGYSTAALAERLFVSTDPQFKMSGILIYTADGDAEGTMGGLVRMGKPGNLEQLVLRALNGAQWCSADPICMEIGAGGGQGPDSCNLAACHSCGLIPETACEELNKFVDRALVVGDEGNGINGFFKGAFM